MKKAVFISFLVSLFVATLHGQTGHNLSFKVSGITRDYALLAYQLGNKQYIKDSAKVNPDGSVVFKGDSVYPAGIYMLVYTPKNDYFEFFVEGNGEQLSIETKAENPIKNAKIKNSPGNKLFFDYLNFLDKKREESKKYQENYTLFKDGYPDSAKKYMVKLEALDKDVLAYQSKIVKEHPTSYLACILNANWSPSTDIKVPPGTADSTAYKFYVYRSHFWDKFPFLDKRIVNTGLLHSKVMEYVEKMTVQEPDSVNKAIKFICDKLRPNPKAYQYAVTVLLNKYAADKRVGFDAVYVFMADEYYAGNKAPWVETENRDRIINNANALKATLLGRTAPPLNLPDTSGVITSLASVKAKYTIVFFYDPDCSHCQADVPKLAAYYNKVKAQGVAVYCVSGGDDKQQWKDFVRNNNLTWTNVYDESGQRKAYDVKTFPQLFILDSNKAILMKRIDIDQMVDYMKTVHGIVQ